MSRVFWLVLTLSLVVALAACTASDLLPSPEVSPIEPVWSESPLLKPTAVLLPSPEPTAVTPPSPEPTAVDLTTPVPSPQPGLGTVTGALVGTQTGLPSSPLANALLYLAPLIYSADGESAMARLDKGNDPVSMTDNKGRFAFANVEPGTYAVVYSVVTSELLIQDPDSDEDLLITVIADQLTDLGKVYVEAPRR